MVTDVKQRRKITAAIPSKNLDHLVAAHQVRFLFKPLKPSKMAAVFDPQKTSEVSSTADDGQNSAKAAVITQKMIFSDLKRRLGDKNLQVLLVEDNPTSQMVLSKYLSRAGVGVEIAGDGEVAVKKVFERGEEVAKLWDLVLVSVSPICHQGGEINFNSVIYICLSKMGMKRVLRFEHGNAKLLDRTFQLLRFQPMCWAMCQTNVQKLDLTLTLLSRLTLMSCTMC
jgi:CheY-like chemotaxis protein